MTDGGGLVEAPRELTSREREILDFLLGALPGAAELREQVRHSTAARSCGCGCPSFDLQVDRSRAPRASAAYSRPAASAWAKDADNHWKLLDLLLWLDDGWVVGVEVSDIADPGDERPDEIPAPDFWDAPVVGAPSTEWD